MGLLDEIVGAVTKEISKNTGIGGFGQMYLETAKRLAPDKMGCYMLYHKAKYGSKVLYVGKAEYGIRHRFVQYYNGTTAHYPSAEYIFENRDEITVFWTQCSTREQCRRLEAKWIAEKHPILNMMSGWAE